MSAGRRKHGRSAAKMVGVALAMFGFGYLLVPLYDVFCEITGLNGKTGRVAEAAIEARYEEDTERTVTVQFVANNNQGMPWAVVPQVATMDVRPGRVYATSFRASNPTSRDMVGQAVPSVAPTVASRFFNKTECFCFDRQPLEAGETKDMPLRFVVSPALPKHVETLTLAYTFFDVSSQAVN
ncbi:MAG: cytochrome c oxidase assembly protein [Gammaproteobacteria bacterium]|jgi:cytochrome c oxidase assembly protein subunit 11